MNDLIFFILTAAVLVSATTAAVLELALQGINKTQLKFRARGGDAVSKQLHSLLARPGDLAFSIRCVLLASHVSLVALLLANMPDVIGGLLAWFLLLIVSVFGARKLTSRSMQLFRMSAGILSRIQVLTRPLARILERYHIKPALAGSEHFVSREELRALLTQPKLAAESDISSDELKILDSMLTFAEKQVVDVMTPKRVAAVVHADDPIGPLLLDELHRSGHSRFPVLAGASSETFVGTLFLRDAVIQKSKQSVKAIMSTDVRYIHEHDSLRTALRAFLKSQHHLFVVVNDFEEFVGVLSIEDVLEAIIGTEIVDEFDQYHDLRAVAKKQAAEQASKRDSEQAKK